MHINLATAQVAESGLRRIAIEPTRPRGAERLHPLEVQTLQHQHGGIVEITTISGNDERSTVCRTTLLFIANLRPRTLGLMFITAA